MAKIRKEEWKVWGNVFDEYTHRNLFKLSAQGLFEGLKSPISIGKEANIFTAETKDNDTVIVKIYRLETADFKRMLDYIKCDERYPNIKRSRRKIIFSWTQREFRNLMKAREAGVRVPMPIAFRDNIIVMEQIGKPKPALQLKDYVPKDTEGCFDAIINNVKTLWENGIVHGDLSQFNILIENENPVFIDFSQGSTRKSANSNELLERDIKNVCNFFAKHGVESDQSKIFKSLVQS